MVPSNQPIEINDRDFKSEYAPTLGEVIMDFGFAENSYDTEEELFEIKVQEESQSLSLIHEI